MDNLPVELLHEIAGHDIGAYRSLLCIPLFGRSLTKNVVTKYWGDFGYSMVIDETGTKYFLNNDFHRIGGPAIIDAVGNKEWCRFGVLDRPDGPAIEWVNGDKEWYRKGKRDRKGEAASIIGKHKSWWEDGKLIKIERPR